MTQKGFTGNNVYSQITKGAQTAEHMWRLQQVAVENTTPRLGFIGDRASESMRILTPMTKPKKVRRPKDPVVYRAGA